MSISHVCEKCGSYCSYGTTACTHKCCYLNHAQEEIAALRAEIRQRKEGELVWEAAVGAWRARAEKAERERDEARKQLDAALLLMRYIPGWVFGAEAGYPEAKAAMSAIAPILKAREGR